MAREINVNRNVLCKKYLRCSPHKVLLFVLPVTLAACQTNIRPTKSSCQAHDVICSEHRRPAPQEDATADYALRSFICKNAAEYQSSSVGNGHCVALIQSCSNTPRTALWRPGRKVVNSTLQTGTVIATFDNGRYPNTHGHHAAIFINQDERGIWVWDQWLGKSVHRRLIRYRNRTSSTAPANTAQDYRVVLAAPAK